MIKFQELFENIIRKSGLTTDQLMEMMEAKKIELSNLVSNEGALWILRKEMFPNDHFFEDNLLEISNILIGKISKSRTCYNCIHKRVCEVRRILISDLEEWADVIPDRLSFIDHLSFYCNQFKILRKNAKD